VEADHLRAAVRDTGCLQLGIFAMLDDGARRSWLGTDLDRHRGGIDWRPGLSASSRIVFSSRCVWVALVSRENGQGTCGTPPAGQNGETREFCWEIFGLVIDAEP